jgi:hypothetical protein
MRIALLLRRGPASQAKVRQRRVRTSGPTPYERDLWAVVKNFSLSDNTPPERRSFDRRPPYLGP